ncbi:MAG: glycosyltransferase family 2 protein [Shimia sp.]
MSWRKVVVATVKDEGPYLLEWIAYHRAIGFDGFAICSNDCTDGTNLMLNRLQQMGIVAHYENPQGPNMDPQRSAYRILKAVPEVTGAEWAFVCDADEFLNVRVGDRSVDALIAASGGADAISVNWRLMGSSGHRTMGPGLVTERFTHGSSHERPENGLVWGFKTLFRPAAFDYFGVHRPRWEKEKVAALPDDAVRWVNGSGEDTGRTFWEKGWRSRTETVGYAHAQVNHDAVKSKEEFLLKRLRGTANSKEKGRIDFDYWRKYDIGTVSDATIPTEGTRMELARLLSDPDLAALHRASLHLAERTLAAQRAIPEVIEFLTS